MYSSILSTPHNDFVDRKKKKKAQSENFVLFGGLTENDSPDTTSQKALSKEVREEPRYIVFAGPKKI